MTEINIKETDRPGEYKIEAEDEFFYAASTGAVFVAEEFEQDEGVTSRESLSVHWRGAQSACVDSISGAFGDRFTQEELFAVRLGLLELWARRGGEEYIDYADALYDEMEAMDLTAD